MSTFRNGRTIIKLCGLIVDTGWYVLFKCDYICAVIRAQGAYCHPPCVHTLHCTHKYIWRIFTTKFKQLMLSRHVNIWCVCCLNSSICLVFWHAPSTISIADDHRLFIHFEFRSRFREAQTRLYLARRFRFFLGYF